MRAPIPRLYPAGTGLLWLADGPERARLALRLLRRAPEHGLDPSRYDVDGLERRLDGLHDESAATALDRALGVAMLNRSLSRESRRHQAC